MTQKNDILTLIEIPVNEKKIFDGKIKEYRKKYIRSSSVLVNEVMEENPLLLQQLHDKSASSVIVTAREMVWQKFLIEESNFNAILLKDLIDIIDTPKQILEKLISLRIGDKSGEELHQAIMDTCGEYAGRIYPYIYCLSLSNTQSRRSRSGSTFQSVIYKVYEYLDYPYNSQKKVGKKIFEETGLGKIVDSILPGIEEFTKRRNKTIIGTMKTSLRERWQEVIEEIARTNIPQIYLLTVDPEITVNKARQMNEHNVTLVVPQERITDEMKNELKNIISFEEYLYTEIPSILEYWKEQQS